MERETMVYLGASLVFMIVMALAIVWCYGIDAFRKWRIEQQRKHVEEFERFVDEWDVTDENYPGCYTQQADKHRAALAREYAKLEAMEKNLVAPARADLSIAALNVE